MAKTGKKIFQVAKELLVGHAEIIAFLQKSGYKTIKTHMSSVDEEMMEKVLARFSKEKKHADTYIKQKGKKDKKDDDQTTLFEQPAEPTPVEVEKQPVIQDAIEKPTTEHELETPHSAEEKPVRRVPTRGTDMRIDETLKTEKPVEAGKLEKKKVDLLETLKSSHKSIEEFKLAFEKARQQLEKQALKDEAGADSFGRRGKKKKGKDDVPEPEVVADDKHGKGKKKKRKKAKVDEKDVEAAIRETLAKMDESKTLGEERQKRKKMKRAEREAETQELAAAEEQNILKVQEYLSVHELADLMEEEVANVIKTCLSLGLMVSINQRLDMDTITLVASEFGFQTERMEEFDNLEIEEEQEEDDVPLVPRSPIVTIMGHVDHGKTSLLDYIRRANVVAGEAGGITQHIGAYEVVLPDTRKITFLDTPGHEAFTAMRARGAQVTDIVVIVVAADDSVMPQTVEAINHAQAAGVPIIIAINKIDKPEANSMRIKTQLSEKNILVEDWGGKYQCVEISAKKGLNVEQLLEKILLEADVMELKAKLDTLSKGTVIEARLDKGRGATATVLVESGTMHVGDPFICGIYSGRVKAMYDERGNIVKAAGPSTPVALIGFDGLPQAGDKFFVTKSERIAKSLALKRQQLKREQDHRRVRFLTLDEISRQVREGKVSNLGIILKGDVDGSVEALSDSIQRLSTIEVKVNIIHRGVGVITESDVLLAAASGAIIIGFHVRPNLNARKLAEKENIDIRYYNIIYDCIEDIRKALEGLLEPEHSDRTTGTVEIREVFKISKVGTIAGCYVVDGKVNRTQPIRLLRNGEVVHEGKLSSLKRFKDDAREVASGFECGITIDNYNDVKVGDVIECYEKVETKRTLSV
ncbi:translation initiation factor IF-2 [bacterium]|nr:MAG: translation initiation factor IF-2 [bacterium]